MKKYTIRFLITILLLVVGYIVFDIVTPGMWEIERELAKKAIQERELAHGTKSDSAAIWKTYQNEVFSFEFKYPSDKLTYSEDLLNTFIGVFGSDTIATALVLTGAEEDSFFVVRVLRKVDTISNIDDLYDELVLNISTQENKVEKITVGTHNAIKIEVLSPPQDSNFEIVEAVYLVMPSGQTLLFGAGQKMNSPTIVEIVATTTFF